MLLDLDSFRFRGCNDLRRLFPDLCQDVVGIPSRVRENLIRFDRDRHGVQELPCLIR